MPFADPLSGRDLAAFVAAVETGSVQGAADTLGLTQSAATKRVQALEVRVGRRLLHRGRLGVRPTPAGERLYPAAKEALDALSRSERALAVDAPALRLLASNTVGELFLPGWLSRFGAQDPGIVAQVSIASSAEVVRGLHRGSADLGFVGGPADLGGLQSLVLLVEELVVVVGADHPWAHRRQVRPTELRNEPFLAREGGSGTRAVAAAVLEPRGIRLVPALEVASTEGLKRAVRDGGFTVLSRVAVERETTDGTLAALRLAGVNLRLELRAVRVRGGPRPGPAGRLWRWLNREIVTRPSR